MRARACVVAIAGGDAVGPYLIALVLSSHLLWNDRLRLGVINIMTVLSSGVGMVLPNLITDRP
jgi:hypothetical protein